jgi:hypothetical protein
MSENYKDTYKSFGLQLIKIFYIGFLFVNFFVLPAIVLSLVIFVIRYDNFINGLLFYLCIVYLAGGFVILTAKFWEFWDDQYILHMRAKWKSSPLMKNAFFKMVIPKDFARDPSDMYGLLSELWGLNSGLRGHYEIYSLGKWYYDFAFDIIIRQKKVEMYFCSAKKRQDIFLKAFHARYPEITMVECEDPYKHWPKDWVEGQGVPGYKTFQGWDYQLAAPDMYPLGDPAKLPGNPMTELLETIQNYDPNSTVILQYNFRPYPNVHEDRWWKNLEKAKSEELAKSTFFEVKDIETGRMRTATTGDLVTQNQKDGFDAITTKINDGQIRSHLRLMIFHPEGKDWYGAIYHRFLKAYAGQISGSNQIISKNWFTSTDRFFIASDTPIFDNILGPILNKFYHPKEVEWRRKCLYSGLLSRDVDISQDSMQFMLSISSACSLFHLPTNLGVFTEELEKKNLPQQGISPNNPNTAPQTFTKLQELRQKATSQNS